MFGLNAEEIALGILSIVSQLFVIVIFFIYLYRTIIFRKKFLTVNLFESNNSQLPSVLKKLNGENILQYARNFTYKNQFFLTNMRFIFYQESLLLGKKFTRYFNIESVTTTEITYKNPYGWLIYVGFNLIIGIANDYRGGKYWMIVIIQIIHGGLFVLLWYYLKGYYLILDNGIISGLFCRSSEGLENTIQKFDLLKLSKDIVSSNEILSKEESSSKDVICNKCKSVLTLEGKDLEKNSFHCPVCGNVNEILK